MILLVLIPISKIYSEHVKFKRLIHVQYNWSYDY